MTCVGSQMHATRLEAREPARLSPALAAVGRAFMLWQVRRATALLTPCERRKLERLGLDWREIRDGLQWMRETCRR